MNKLKMKLKLFTTMLTMLIISVQLYAANLATQNKNIIMVVSSYGKEQGKVAPGYEFDEFAKAYLVFKENGFNVDIASPKGGAIEADPYDSNKPYNAKVLADKEIMAKLTNTLATKNINANHYDAVFVVGGKGAMFDLPKDKALQAVIADIYQQQGSVAAVCHGPAALVNVTLKDGSYLVADKAINSFTNQEEKLFGKKWLKSFDFLLQDKLIERGAKFESTHIMLSHVAIDNRLITGQNPSSTVDVANALVRSLGVIPAKVEQDQDDKTLALVARFLKGDNTAIATLAEHQQDYQMPLVGMYGFYFLKLAQNDKQLSQALALMTAAKAAINNPKLDITIAKTQHKLGDSHAAKLTLNQLLANKPNYQPAIEMLKTLAL